jgi:DNA-binding transcriptional ArsR family regulator
MSTIRLMFSPTDLTRTRFAFSPLWETVMSFRATQDPGRFAIHLPWLTEARQVLPELNVTPLSALVRPQGYMPDFLTPPPSRPDPTFTEELDQLRATDAGLIRSGVEGVWHDRATMPASAQVFLDHPERALAELADALEAYWTRLLAPHWPKFQTLFENDLIDRARQLALHGPEAMFRDLGPLMRLQGTTLELHESLCSASYPDPLPLAGRGLLLLPSAFVWPAFATILDPPWQPTLAYTPRGLADLWSQTPPTVNQALEGLLGKGRAEVLLRLETPSSTQELARQLKLAPSSVSDHLSTLRQAGLVESRRQGRAVYYRLSQLGRGLIDLYTARTPMAGIADPGADIGRSRDDVYRFLTGPHHRG